MEFPYNTGAMYLNRPNRYPEFVSDLPVCFSFRQELNYLNLTRSGCRADSA